MTTLILYYNPKSICSLMVRYTFAVSGARDVSLELRDIDITNDEQLDEHFLCDVNPKGQVPVMVVPGLQTPIRDSLDTTYYLCDQFQSLRPVQHADLITRLLKDLHSINYFTLSFGKNPAVAQIMKAGAEKLLAQPDISAKYRAALEYKLSVTKSEKIQGLLPEKAAENELVAKRFVAEVDELMRKHKKPSADGEALPWIFGTPTALDSSLVVFIVRMVELGRANLFPADLLNYADRIGNTAAFKDIYVKLK